MYIYIHCARKQRTRTAKPPITPLNPISPLSPLNPMLPINPLNPTNPISGAAHQSNDPPSEFKI